MAGNTIPPPPPGFSVIPPPPPGFTLDDPLASVRKAVGGNINVTSEYRTPQHNREVGGVPNSDHLRPGGAYDFVVPGETPAQAVARMRAAGVPAKQLLAERDHVHYAPIPPPPAGFSIVPPPPPGFSVQHPAAPQSTPKPAAPQDENAIVRRAKEAWADAHRKPEPWENTFGAGPIAGPMEAMRLFGDVIHTVIGGPAEEAAKRLPHGDAGKKQISFAKTPEQQKVDAQPYNRQEADKAAGDAAEFFVPVPGGKAKAGIKAAEEVGEAARVGAAKVFSPEHVSDTSRAAAALHRAILGKWGTTADKEAYLLSHHARALRKLTPEQTNDFIDYVERRSDGSAPPDAPPRPGVSGKVSGARKKILGRIQDMAENTPLRRSANAIRDMADRYKARIQYVLGTEAEGGPTFIRDYYAHLWKQKPEEVEAAMAQGSKQGSGANLRKRTVPTYSDGLARGLTPRYENPIDAMTAYNENMAKFLATHEIKDAMVERNLASWHRPGSQPDGWVPLDGKLAERMPQRRSKTPRSARGPDQLRLPAPGREIPVGDTRALPPPGDAPRGVREPPQGVLPDQGGRVAGLRSSPLPVVRPGEAPGAARVGDGGQPLQIEDAAAKARRVESGAEPVEPTPQRPRDKPPQKEILYAHPDAARIYNNNISKGFEGGDIGPFYRGTRAVVNGLVQLKLGLSAFHAAVIGQEGIVGQLAQAIGEASRGKFAQAGKTALTAPIAPLRLARQGSRMAKEILGVKPPTEFSAKLNDLYARSGARLSMDRIYSPRASGSFFSSMKRGTFKRDIMAAGKRILGDNPEGGWDRAKGVVDLAGNIIQSAAAPIFEDYVPNMKRGAWSSRMAAFMKENPGASEAELEKYGRQVLDSVDNRFGELIHNNLFWKRQMFQTAQLLFLSPGWNIGTAREIGGGIANIPKSMVGLMKGKGIDEKTAYVAALVSFTSLQNGLLTYMHTGQMPEGMDYFAYRTGGVNPDGSPERAMIPGYMKDVLGFMMQDPRKELVNKLNPGLREAWELYNNKDYRGLPIDAKLPGEKGTGDYLSEQNAPISLGDSSRAKKGSGLSVPERLMGVRPSPAYVQNPERRRQLDNKYGLKDHKRKLRSDARQGSQYEP